MTTIDEDITATEHLLALQRAIKEDKVIQYLNDGLWIDITGVWSWERIYSNLGRYRIKPEPKIRPFRPEEVPVGALYRDKETKQIEGMFMPGQRYPSKFMDYREWCWPHEQFDESKWKPCGVVKS